MSLPFPLKPVTLLVANYYLNFLSRIILGPLLPVIEVEFGLGHGEAGTLFLFLVSGYALGLFGSAFVSSRLNHRRTILLSAIMLGGAMLAMSRLTSIPRMRVGLVIVGISAGFFFPSGIAMLTELVRKEHWGKVMSIHEFAPTLALITAPLLVEFLLTSLSWRGILAMVGACLILLGGLFMTLAQGGTQRGEPPNPKAIQKILSSPSFWVMTAVLTLSVGANVGIYSMLPLFLVNELGFSREFGNTLIGFSRIFGVIGLFISGSITDRMGRKQAMILFLAIMGTLTIMLGALRGPLATPTVMVLQATFIPCCFAAAFAMFSLTVRSSHRSLAVSLSVLIGFLLGGGAMPPAIGYLADALSFSVGFSLIGVLVLAILPLSFYLAVDSHA